jgi:cation transporter-like permease
MDRARFQKVLRRAVAIPLVLALALIFAVQSLVNHEQWVERTDEVTIFLPMEISDLGTAYAATA